MNNEIAQKVINQWRSFVNKRKEVRNILIAQYKDQYVKILSAYKEMKRKKFQAYIVNNASHLIRFALTKNMQKNKFIRSFIQLKGIKRIYFLKQQENIYKKIINIPSYNSPLKTIRAPLMTQHNHKSLIPQLYQEIKTAIILYNFHSVKKLFGETNKSKDIITYEFLYQFNQLVTVKLSQKQFKMSQCEESRYLTVLKRIDKFQQEEYSQLKYVELNNINLLLKIYAYNKKNPNNQLRIFFDCQLREIAAICKIQKYFRGSKNIKLNGMTYNSIMRLINSSRAVFVIQRWFRRLRSNHRNNFYKEISFYACQIPTPYVYLDMQIYSKIEDIINNQHYTLQFLEQYNEIVSDNDKARLHFKAQQQDIQNQSTYTKNIAFLDELNIPCIPNWLIKQIQIVHEQEYKNIDRMIVKKVEQSTKWNCRNRQYQNRCKESLKDLLYNKVNNIYALLHLGSKISFDHINHRDYIRFEYSSTTEARYRTIALALCTYRFKQNGHCILLFNDNIWESTENKQESFLIKYYQKLKLVFKIDSPILEHSFLNNQEHPTIILCQNDNKQATNFQLQQNIISLQFFNEEQRISNKFIWMNNDPNKQIETSQISPNQYSIDISQNSQFQNNIFSTSIEMKPYIDGSSKSTQIPVKFSILCLENQDIKFQEPKFKKRTEQTYSEFVCTSRFRTQNFSFNSSKVESSKIIESFPVVPKQNEKKLSNISETTEYSLLKRKYDEQFSQEKKEKVKLIKSKRENEKVFQSDFCNFTTLIQRQEQKLHDKQIKTQRANSITNRYTRMIKSVKATVSKSVSRKDDYNDYQEVVFPKIEPRYKKKTQENKKLSNYCRYAVFPEEVYAISNNKDTLKF